MKFNDEEPLMRERKPSSSCRPRLFQFFCMIAIFLMICLFHWSYSVRNANFDLELEIQSLKRFFRNVSVHALKDKTELIRKLARCTQNVVQMNSTCQIKEKDFQTRLNDCTSRLELTENDLDKCKQLVIETETGLLNTMKVNNKKLDSCNNEVDQLTEKIKHIQATGYQEEGKEKNVVVPPATKTFSFGITKKQEVPVLITPTLLKAVKGTNLTEPTPDEKENVKDVNALREPPKDQKQMQKLVGDKDEGRIRSKDKDKPTVESAESGNKKQGPSGTPGSDDLPDNTRRNMEEGTRTAKGNQTNKLLEEEKNRLNDILLDDDDEDEDYKQSDKANLTKDDVDKEKQGKTGVTTPLQKEKDKIMEKDKVDKRGNDTVPVSPAPVGQKNQVVIPILSSSVRPNEGSKKAIEKASSQDNGDKVDVDDYNL